jgi:epoxyqueuosine reductase
MIRRSVSGDVSGETDDAAASSGSPSPAEAARLVRARAAELGFDAVGIARADEALGLPYERFASFVARGMHGEMTYLAENVEARARLDSSSVLLGARSIVCLGHRYARAAADEASDPLLAQKMARYARGQDYHNHVRRKVRKLATYVRTLGQGTRARPLCDVEPVMERAWAARAGLGFVGKNGLVITPGQGSYQILGEVVTTLVLTPDTPIAERCGSCTRCLDACPTSAFVEPFVLDPRRCISYATIEAQSVPEPEDRSAVGEHLFGCDICQEVCPFNRTAPPLREHTKRFAPLEKWGRKALTDFVLADEAAWESLSEGTPLKRAGRVGMARNAVLVAARTLAAGAAEGREEALSVLTSATRHEDDGVRSLAAEALERARRDSGQT